MRVNCGHVQKLSNCKLCTAQKPCILHEQKAAYNAWVLSAEKGYSWNKEKVQKFWETIRSEIKNGRTNFDYVIFPNFETMLFKEGDSKEQSLVFDANFWFAGEKNLQINFSFKNAIFKADTLFDSIEFIGADFSGAVFENKFAVKDSVFRKSISFKESEFYGEFYFDSVVFGSEISFENAKFYKHSFFINSLKDSAQKTLSNKDKYISLRHALFDSKVFFIDFNLRAVLLEGVVINDLHIHNCKIFIPYKGKNIILDEYKSLPINTLQKAISVGNIYRAMKRLMDERKDHQTADMFYVGEMRMRELEYKLRLKRQKETLLQRLDSMMHFLLLKVYRIISFYNFSPWRAFLFLIFLFVLGTFAFYFAGHGALAHAIDKALVATIPLVDFSVDERNTIVGLELAILHILEIVSAIAWVLFALSLRDKFRR